MPGEGEEECTRAVEQFKHLVFYDLAGPEAFITDNDKALRKALNQVFEGVPRILCSLLRCYHHFGHRRPSFNC
jgi:hypothetical protein